MHTIPVSDNSEIRVTKDTVNGITFGQIRLWTKKKDTDEMIPTRKGVAFNPELAPKIIEGLIALDEQTVTA